jgi:hypothetical protein
MTIDEFISKVSMRPLPQNQVAIYRNMARELAEGALAKIWFTNIDINSDIFKDKIRPFLESRYDKFDYNVDFPLLMVYEYLERNDKQRNYIITKNAFDLLHEDDAATIFISYKRSESSAFALLVRNELKAAGLSPFVDMQLQPGQQWHAELEKNIKNSDYFIILLGNKTLESTVTIQEIQWALDAKIAIIPIWHNGFVYKSGDWSKIPMEVDNALRNTHTIRVIEENPLTYDTALRELLNRFGISS